MSDCIFCKIIAGEIPGKFVYRDEEVIAFYDISPKAPVHVLVLPVKHISSLIETTTADTELLGTLMVKVQEIAKKLGLPASGYKVVVNNGKGSGQLVFHLHIHLLGGWKSSPGWEV